MQIGHNGSRTLDSFVLAWEVETYTADTSPSNQSADMSVFYASGRQCWSNRKDGRRINGLHTHLQYAKERLLSSRLSSFHRLSRLCLHLTCPSLAASHRPVWQRPAPPHPPLPPPLIHLSGMIFSNRRNDSAWQPHLWFPLWYWSWNATLFTYVSKLDTLNFDHIKAFQKHLFQGLKFPEK